AGGRRGGTGGTGRQRGLPRRAAARRRGTGGLVAADGWRRPDRRTARGDRRWGTQPVPGAASGRPGSGGWSRAADRARALCPVGGRAGRARPDRLGGVGPGLSQEAATVGSWTHGSARCRRGACSTRTRPSPREVCVNGLVPLLLIGVLALLLLALG